MERMLRLALNTKGNDYLITDTHGCWDEVRELLHLINFDTTKDRLLHGGDMVDRGPDSVQCLTWMQEEWLESIPGNHEFMAIGIAQGMYNLGRYITHGGEWFVDLPSEQQKQFAAIFQLLPFALEIDTPHGLVGVIHADPLDTWTETTETIERFDTLPNNKKHEFLEHVLWSRERLKSGINYTVPDIWRVYVGHTPVQDMHLRGNIGYIDTGVVYGNKLTCINLTEDRVITIPSKRTYWDCENSCAIPPP